MDIEVIIPTLNEEDIITESIRTVKERSVGHVSEVVVVDGGSTDATVSRADEAGATVFETSQKGRARQMNMGAVRTSAPLLYFLHADSKPPVKFDQQIMDAFNDNYPAGCFRLAFDLDHPILNFYAWCTRFDIDAFRFGDQSLFITRELFEELNGFDEDLMVMEDNVMVREIKKEAQFSIIADNVVTSSRKYERVGVIRLQLIFILIYTLFFVGFSQEQLVSTYKKLVS